MEKNNTCEINKIRINNIMETANNAVFNLSYLVDDGTVNKGLEFSQNFKQNLNLIIINKLNNMIEGK
ncbi:hypothetical protein ACVWU4_001026 [Campylobacter coli]